MGVGSLNLVLNNYRQFQSQANAILVELSVCNFKCKLVSPGSDCRTFRPIVVSATCSELRQKKPNALNQRLRDETLSEKADAISHQTARWRYVYSHVTGSITFAKTKTVCQDNDTSAFAQCVIIYDF